MLIDHMNGYIRELNEIVIVQVATKDRQSNWRQKSSLML